MKRICLFLVVLLCVNESFGNSFTTLWTSVGLTKSKDDGVSFSHGITWYKGVANGVGIGFTGFYQKMGRYYGDQENAAVGATMRFSGSYAFIAPMVVSHLTHKGQIQAYVNAGIGYKINAYDSIHQWSKVSWAPGGLYDNKIDASENLKSLIYRIGIGFTEYYYLKGNWRITVTEDFGILPAPISKTDANYHNEGINNITHQFFKPTYFSLTVGITYRTRTGDEGRGRRRMSGR
jgi:hypothetical protein